MKYLLITMTLLFATSSYAGTTIVYPAANVPLGYDSSLRGKGGIELGLGVIGVPNTAIGRSLLPIQTAAKLGIEAGLRGYSYFSKLELGVSPALNLYNKHSVTTITDSDLEQTLNGHSQVTGIRFWVLNLGVGSSYNSGLEGSGMIEAGLNIGF